MNTKLFLFGLWVACLPQAARAQTPVVFENAHVRYTISAAGKNLGFVDRASGTDYLQPGPPSPCAWVRRGDKQYPASSAVLNEGRLTLQFGEADATAVLKVEPRPDFLRLTVASIQGAELESLVFLNIPLTLKATPNEAFGACAFSLNLATRVDALPALQSELRASCHRKFGMIGAKAAIVGRPMKDLLPALKAVLTEADEMPLCQVAGPWAAEVPFNHGSYLFNFGSLTETNVEDWIGMVKDLGFTQIDNHGGSADFFRFGDFALNRQKWPEGWETYRRIVARLHAAGIGSIFHTYAFFIDKHSKYVTPVPDPRLDAFRTFTLAEEIAPDAKEIRVNEPTAGMSTLTGFFEHNSVVLHLGDELVTFGGVSAAAPWRFTDVKRGALGTKPAAHGKGDPARHLKECFGLFVPNPESSLFEEIAANHAEVVNRGDFDGLYLDAIDGCSILRGPDECWYWADKFVFEIQKRLKKPVGMEMSAMWHHFWQYRTRWQAWDYPQRGQTRFLDLHAEGVNGGLLLPLHLGWWNFQSFDPPQVEPAYPEMIAQLGAKLIGWDAGISLTGGVDRERLRTVPLFRRDMEVLRACEELRHARVVDDRVKALLREPGREFALATNALGKPCFRRSHAETRTVAAAEPGTLSWPIVNPYAGQPVRLRIEALMSAGSYDDTNAITLADWSGPDAPKWQASAAAGVTSHRLPTPEASSPAAVDWVAANAGKVPQNAAWARLERPFEPRLDLKKHQALGLWVEGDGRGEILAIRLESPRHISFGAIADRYLTVDFTGRRYFTLVETESARWSDYVWNDGKSLYNVYRETIDFGAIESASVWYQNLPPGREVKCRLGALKALPMLSATIQDPAISINGVTVEFPVALASGHWIEGNGPDDCAWYGAKGEFLGKVTPRSPYPELKSGTNLIRFSAAGASQPPWRVRVTVFSRGEEL